MDPASAAVALLAPYLAKLAGSFASKASEAAFEGGKSLYEAVKRKFSSDGDKYAEETLSRLEKQPDDEGRQVALKSVLTEKAAADEAFAEQLKQLVDATTGGRPLTQNVLNQVYGGSVGKIITVQTVDTMTIN